MKKTVLLIIAFLMLPSSLVAQKDFSDLDQVGDAIKERIREDMKDWKCHDIEPMAFENTPPSDDLRIQQWVSGSRDVRLVLHRHPSAVEASRALRQFAATSRVKGYVNGLADEAYIHGGRNAIAFRKGNLLVYVSAIVIKENYTDAEKKDPKYASGLDLDEEAKLTSAFAQHVASALKKL